MPNMSGFMNNTNAGLTGPKPYTHTLVTYLQDCTIGSVYSQLIIILLHERE